MMTNAIDGPRYAIIEAPSGLGLLAPGVEKLPKALLDYGLAERIDARRAGEIETPSYSGKRDPETLTLNAPEIAAFAPKLADAVESVLEGDEFPLILGGDCSILLGSMLALRRRARYGLLFIDGHTDFYQPEVNPTGEAASMELAFATGHGPALLTNIEGREPLVREEDAFAFGYRDAEEQEAYGSRQLPPLLRAFDLEMVHAVGVGAAAREAVMHVARDELDGFFVHVDADCLNDAIMPAVDYRLPGGLAWKELETTLKIALASGRAVGIEVAIYNPDLDRDGTAGRGLVEVLSAGLSVSQ